MGLRCWPGCLAVTTHSARPGMLVEVIRLAPQGAFMLPHGVESCVAKHGPRWLVRGARGPLPLVMASGRSYGEVPYAVCPDKFLRPITLPPGAETETVEQVLEAARGDAVSA